MGEKALAANDEAYPPTNNFMLSAFARNCLDKANGKPIFAHFAVDKHKKSILSCVHAHAGLEFISVRHILIIPVLFAHDWSFG